MKIVQDTLLGFFFTVTGGVALLMAWQYPFGTAGRMGPGYFPVIVSGLLLVTGVCVIIRSMAASGDSLAQIRWKPLLLVPGAVIAFGLAVEPLGLFVAILLLLVISAVTSSKFRWTWKALAGALAFAGLCCLLFVQLIGLPMPLVGTWLQ
jgi:putative tricarboxylic transport membrane protein